MNKWGIPQALETLVRARDRNCVYCGVELTEWSARGDRTDGEKLAGMLEKLELGLRPKQTYEVDASFFEAYKK
jgi:hypothetical protein